MVKTWNLVLVHNWQNFKSGDIVKSGFVSFEDAEDYNKCYYNDPDYSWDEDIQICKVVENLK